MAKFCISCGKEMDANQQFCPSCGSAQTAGTSLMDDIKGVAQIIVTIVTCGVGGLWGFIEGILILTGSINTDAEGKPLTD